MLMTKKCCDYCQDKYIDRNGVINKSDVDKREKAMKKRIQKFLDNPANKGVSADHIPVFKPCTCDCMCHVRGMDVLHSS